MTDDITTALERDRWTVRIRFIERPGRWKLVKALLRGEYRTSWFDPRSITR